MFNNNARGYDLSKLVQGLLLGAGGSDKGKNVWTWAGLWMTCREKGFPNSIKLFIGTCIFSKAEKLP